MAKIYQFTVDDAQGNAIALSQFERKVLLIVNTASECGFTPQYAELEALHQTYKDRGLVVLAFPCNQFGKQEPGDNKAIQQFCQLNYGVNFPVMAKVDVNGSETAPLFAYLKNQARGVLKTQAIKWNFTKFLVNKQGEVVKRYAPRTKPKSLSAEIEQLLAD
jgi:glutathione peroxidase